MQEQERDNLLTFLDSVDYHSSVNEQFSVRDKVKQLGRSFVQSSWWSFSSGLNDNETRWKIHGIYYRRDDNGAARFVSC